MIGPQPGWWHDPRWCVWRFYDRRGQEIAAVSDEAFARERFSPRDLVMASS